MKRLVLLFAIVLIGLNTAAATELTNQKNGNDLKKIKPNRYSQPITFMERGVEFLIFPDGSFDFNTNTRNSYDDAYYKSNSRRGNINVSYRGPNTNIQYTNTRINRGIDISRDRNGTVKRIGNVYLNYDRQGRITRAGSIFIDYDKGRHSYLSRVGGLRVDYNKWGEITKLRGQVNRFNTNCNFCGTLSCYIDRGHETRNHNNDWYDRFNDDVYNNDDNYFYYKQNGKVKKQKKNKR